MTHTPEPWEVSKHGTPESHPQFGVYAEGRHNDHVIVRGENASADAHLIAAAPTAPHDCDDPKCSGASNKRKLAAFDEILAALKLALQIIEGENLDEKYNEVCIIQDAIAEVENRQA